MLKTNPGKDLAKIQAVETLTLQNPHDWDEWWENNATTYLEAMQKSISDMGIYFRNDFIFSILRSCILEIYACIGKEKGFFLIFSNSLRGSIEIY